MFRISVTFILLLLASSKAWDFDLLLETIYDHFESCEDEDSSESSENSTKPATSSTASSASPASTTSPTTAAPSTVSSTAVTPPSSSAATLSATPLSAPSARRRRDLSNFQPQPKGLYDNVPYSSNYAPNYKGFSKSDRGNGREPRRRNYHTVKSENGPDYEGHHATKNALINLLLKLLENSEKEAPTVKHPNISQRIRITIPQEKVHRVVVDESNLKDKQKCKSDDKNYITCVTDRKIYETIKIDPKDHSEVHKIEENIRVSIVKDDKPPKDEAVDKVFKRKPPHMYTASYEEDDYYPYPYHHRHHDKNRGHHRHEYITSSRFNAEDDVKESEKKESPTTDATETAS